MPHRRQSRVPLRADPRPGGEAAGDQADIVTVNRAALNRLRNAADSDTFAAAWATVRDAFDLLYNDPRNVTELRQAILQLAVQGKLVPQDPAESRRANC